MSGFDAGWLSLRAAADNAARSRRVLAALTGYCRDRDALSVVDLGAGTGSLLRALAPRLGPRQRWRLVDHDPALLTAAQSALSDWAEAAESRPEGLTLLKDGAEIAVELRPADLTQEIAAIIEGADLVTASALYDLMPLPWILQLADLMAARRGALYACLSYDGRMLFSPSLPEDAAIVAAFNWHQRGMKHGERACGPEGGALLRQALALRGARAVEGESPWDLMDAGSPMNRAVLAGILEAVAESGLLPDARLAAWRAAREAVPPRIHLGHTDLFASWA